MFGPEIAEQDVEILETLLKVTGSPDWVGLCFVLWIAPVGAALLTLEEGHDSITLMFYVVFFFVYALLS